MQKLTLEGVKEAARQWYHLGKLTAQAPLSSRYCAFHLVDSKGTEYRCAVGAALSDESISEARKIGILGGGTSSLMRANIVEVDPADIEAICLIQSQHDDWAHSAENLRAHREATFLAGIAVSEPAEGPAPGSGAAGG